MKIYRVMDSVLSASQTVDKWSARYNCNVSKFTLCNPL